jgi:predicted pyridoxine 5'-phosphate oxidase superfamily flavin-nucleotide-binding protein
MSEIDAIQDWADLQTMYREPMEHIAAKVAAIVDPGSAAFLARSTLAVIATTSDSGNDASPRSGPAGFMHVLDDGA